MTEADPATPTATSPDKPRRARKAKPKPSATPTPKRTRAPRVAPVRTLRRRIDDLGPCHLEAFERARKRGGEAYEEQIRAALDARDQLASAKARNDAARTALAEAATDLVDAEKIELDSRPILDRLTLAAKTLAGLDANDVEPDAPTEREPLKDSTGCDV